MVNRISADHLILSCRGYFLFFTKVLVSYQEFFLCNIFGFNRLSYRYLAMLRRTFTTFITSLSKSCDLYFQAIEAIGVRY
jgi:hypothetical protein